MMRALTLLVGLILLAGGLPQPANAASAYTVANTTGKRLALELNTGKLVRLDRPAAAVFIANAEIADVSVKSPRLVYVFGRRPGETTLFAVDARENVIADVPIQVTHNIGRLNEVITQLLPSSGVAASSVDGGIVLTGSVGRATDSENLRRLAMRFIGPEEEIINRLQVTEPHQVNLRVRVAEVARDVIREFGINWEAAVDGAVTFGIATGRPFIPGAPVSPPQALGSFITRQDSTNSTFFNATPRSVDLNILIDSLAQDGLVTVLAEPNLTAISGETATFLAGGEFPIPVSRDDNDIGIEFKEFGVSLAFTPTVIDGSRVSMRVRPEVSQLSANGAITIADLTIPALATRRAETTVELGSGQSLAIAGMILERRENNTDNVPGLSDIPILGPLFDSERFRREETELVIIVTPYLVRPVSDPGALAAPTDAFFGSPPKSPTAATARRTVPLTAAQNQQPGLIGPAGFLIE